ncbi:hypothetical protein [Nereida sp. MMG025]|uniref:hypothetical protein n=1 Tax=Nereida sp. MMG025 TaxID=2909981 RepID=UPI001F36C6B8|nr:hypothetical protein [Nereida sp. MMG025]MCF6445322.1 hypothetical protein [Nereida sp. MMG025]
MTGFSLKDHLFNAATVKGLADEISSAHPDFDAKRFQSDALAGFAERELKARIEWLADCLQAQAPSDFAAMADWIEAALPPPLDPAKTDDDFGHFIHAPYGVLIARHGTGHVERALSAIHAVTQRFSMEYAVRFFLTDHADQTLDHMADWVRDPNYHVRRLVSEGTRPTLPWAPRIGLDVLRPLPLLDALHADPTRYVTRSVCNHLNDVAKVNAKAVYDRLDKWRAEGDQNAPELDWMSRHALRTLIKQGEPGAMERLGYRPNAEVDVTIEMPDEAIIDDVTEIAITLLADQKTPVLVDYAIDFRKADGRQKSKVFKVKQCVLQPNEPLRLVKRHRFKGDATTFRLYPGKHDVHVMVNGVVRASQRFDLLEKA